ncbi:hypothetical protein [Sphingomonas sp.]|uniref:hypothetical protein n=1 Tax=Sphingomonas sp. TaxID=28214 RepID=UPI0031D12973
MLVQLIGGAPRVMAMDGKVAIHETVDGEAHGFLLKPAAAATAAARILSVTADLVGRETCIFPVEALELSGGHVIDGERFARLVLTVHGAPLAVEFNATQVAELAAGFAAASRKLDAPDSD